MIEKNDPRLTDFVLGELDSQESQRISAEIESSSELQQAVAEIEQTTQLLGQAFEAETKLQLSDDQRSQLLRAANEPSVSLPQPSFQSSWHKVRLWVAGVAAALVCMLAGAVYFSGFGNINQAAMETSSRNESVAGSKKNNAGGLAGIDKQPSDDEETLDNKASAETSVDGIPLDDSTLRMKTDNKSRVKSKAGREQAMAVLSESALDTLAQRKAPSPPTTAQASPKSSVPPTISSDSPHQEMAMDRSKVATPGRAIPAPQFAPGAPLEKGPGQLAGNAQQSRGRNSAGDLATSQRKAARVVDSSLQKSPATINSADSYGVLGAMSSSSGVATIPEVMDQWKTTLAAAKLAPLNLGVQSTAIDSPQEIMLPRKGFVLANEKYLLPKDNGSIDTKNYSVLTPTNVFVKQTVTVRFLQPVATLTDGDADQIIQRIAKQVDPGGKQRLSFEKLLGLEDSLVQIKQSEDISRELKELALLTANVPDRGIAAGRFSLPESPGNNLEEVATYELLQLIRRQIKRQVTAEFAKSQQVALHRKLPGKGHLDGSMHGGGIASGGGGFGGGGALAERQTKDSNIESESSDKGRMAKQAEGLGGGRAPQAETDANQPRETITDQEEPASQTLIVQPLGNKSIEEFDFTRVIDQLKLALERRNRAIDSQPAEPANRADQ